jgi:hypothetical protein
MFAINNFIYKVVTYPVTEDKALMKYPQYNIKKEY